jgi:penicillin-binding protein 1B
MQDVLNRGTAARARQMGFTATGAGKTGTSRDGWFAGYTPNLVCVVWVGFDDNSELGLEGSKSALPIWASFMKQALQFRPDLGGSEFTKPDTITSAEIEPASGLLADDACPNHRTEYFVNGTEPQMTCSSKPGQSEDVPLKPETEPAEEPTDPLDKMKKIMKDAVQERREDRKQQPKPEDNKPPNKP